jgi:hypothetical protein
MGERLPSFSDIAHQFFVSQVFALRARDVFSPLSLFSHGILAVPVVSARNRSARNF